MADDEVKGVDNAPEGKDNSVEAASDAENNVSSEKSTGRKPAGNKRDRSRRDRKRKRDRDDRPVKEFSETLIDIYRCSATVKGGRRLSFGALVTVGNGKGKVGIGYAKAKEVPGAIQKAIKSAHGCTKSFVIAEGDTIPHQIIGRFGSSKVILIPARPGTGVIAGAAVKAILEAGGLKNVLTKSVGSNNTRNIVKATINALDRLRSKEVVQNLRGVEL